jgi:very-short-patch-repair endonuclease
VLFTRARRSVALYTSLRPEDIVVDGSTPEGTKALRNYLEYARTGSLAVPVDDGREPDSEFEVAVISCLRSRGYEVTPQLGVAGFRIDIAVRHPDAPGTYLAAIECDGASYHSAQSVRDRDRIRQEILESLGWRGQIWRIWSTDWFRSPRQEAERLFGFLERIRNTWKPEHAAGESWIEERHAVNPPEEVADKATDDMPGISEVLLETDDDQEVQFGDLVRYANIEKLDDILTVQITEGPSDIASGVVSVTTPLAQALLGAVVGDEVSLHQPGARPRAFRIIMINRQQSWSL